MTRIDWEALQRKTFTILLLLVLGYLGLQAAAYFRDVLSIVVSSIILAYLLQLLVEPLSRWIPRFYAVLTVTIGFLVSIVLVVSFLIPLLVQQLRLLLISIPEKLDQLQTWLYHYQSKLAVHHFDVNLDRVYAWVFPRIERYTQHFGDNLPSFVMGSFFGFFSTAMVLVCAFYFLKDSREIKKGLLSLFPRRTQDQLDYLMVLLNSSLHHYFLGQVINASVVLVLSTLSFSLLRMDFGIIAGIVWGVLEVIPYFGTYIGIGLALVLASWQGGGLLVKILIAALIIQQLKD
ncbi:MAG: AI-2E family transporter, partial [Bacteroidota bacterium]